MSFLIDLIPKPVLLAMDALLIALVMFLTWQHITDKFVIENREHQITQLKLDHSTAVQHQQEQLEEAMMRRDQQQANLQAHADEERKLLNEKLTAVSATAASLRLRFLPHSGPIASGNSGTASLTSPRPAPIDHNITLLPSDIGVLIDESSRADEIRLKYLECSAAYTAAQTALKE